MSLVGMIVSKANKCIKQAIWRGNTNVTAGIVHALVLMLLSANIIALTAPESLLEKQKLVPLRTVHFALTKQFASNDDAFETGGISY